MRDAKSAIRWVRTHAVEFGIDENRIAAGGGSAGGHLKLTLDFK
jgi:acetyl esterase/lipase